MGSWADRHVELLQKGVTVKFRPRGNSMDPLIKSGQLVTVVPLSTWHRDFQGPLDSLGNGQIVLCKVKGRHYLHRTTAFGGENGEGASYRIENNKGHVNGWTRQIYGVVVQVED